MEQKLKDILLSQFPNRSPQEVLASYDHIELTEEETIWATVDAKMKKERLLEIKAYEDRVAENRKLLSGKQWTFLEAMGKMEIRSNLLGVDIDIENILVFRTLCSYFSTEPFATINPNKGILLVGNVGTGKTWMMNLFSKNPRMCFHTETAQKIAETYEETGPEAKKYYCQPHKNPINDADMFYQPVAGLCIEDIGQEEVKKNYGNKSNVIGDIIETRYFNGLTGPLLHGTTNLTAEQLDQYYGPRVRSRMREVFNFIELTGKDRRK